MVPRPSEASIQRIKIIGFSFILVLIPFVIYYYYWVSNQTKYFTGRDLRVLAALTRYVEDTVQNQRYVVYYAATKFLSDLDSQANKNKNTSIDRSSKDQNDSTSDKTDTYEKLKDNRDELKRDFQTKALDPLRKDGTNLTITSLELVEKPADGRPSIEADGSSTEIVQQGELVYFSQTITYPTSDRTGLDEDQSASEGKGRPPLYVNFKISANLADPVRQFLNTRQSEDSQDSAGLEGFDAIIVAQVKDSVDAIFLRSNANLRIVSLNNLKATDGSAVDLKNLGQSTNVVDVKVGAGDYKLFFQPLELHQKHENKSSNLLVCGLIESGRFRHDTWAVSYTLVIIFFFLAALVALSWPFLKLMLIGPKDRLRPIDTYLLVVSAVMITALLTLFAVFSTSYLRAERVLDTDLQSFADALQKNFDRELQNALQEIDKLNCDPRLWEKQMSNFPRPERCGKPQTTVKPEERVPGYPSSRSLIFEDPPKDDPYPYFQSVFWADRLGWQRTKWTVRPNLTENIYVGRRDYFSKLQEDQHYTYGDHGDHKFYLLPIVSKTTGESEVVISKRVFSPAEEQQGLGLWSISVSALNTKLLSLMQPIIPSGFGFAVIEESGKVLFHSDEKRHRGENFFEESDNNEELRAAVLGHSSQPLTVSYLGKGHSMYVRPMGVSQFNWTVIAFRNKDYLRTTFSEIMTLCSVLFLAHLVFTLIVLLGVYLINRTSREPVAWLWPAPDKTRVYASLMVLNLGLILISVLSVRWLPGLWKITVPATTSFAAIVLYVWTLKRAKESYLSPKLMERITRRAFFNHRTVYTINATLLFTLISIIPAYACFKLAYVEEMKLFIKEGQLHLARNMSKREERLRTQYLAGVLNEKQQAMQQFVDKRLADTTYDVYNNFFFSTELLTCPSERCEGVDLRDSKLIKFFKNFVPLFNQSSIQRHALLSSASDNAWKWQEQWPDKLLLNVTAPLTTRQGKTPLHIVSTLPRMNGSAWWFIWPVLMMAVALLVTYMCRQMFLFKRNETACDELNGFTTESVCQNLFFVLNPPFIGRRELYKRLGFDKGQIERIDIAKAAEVERWVRHFSMPANNPARTATAAPQVTPTTLVSAAAPATSSEASPSNTTSATAAQKPAAPRLVVLDNFDSGFDNADFNRQRLSLLEKLHEKERVAIAVSNYDPERFMNGKSEATNGTDSVVSVIMSERWTGAMSRFLKVTLEDLGDAESFRTTLRNRKRQVLSDKKLVPEAKQRVEDVFARIERECSPRACLQRIGTGIADQRNISEQTPESVTKQVFIQAMSYYKSLWSVCSDDEKLTLKHLAHDGLLSSTDPDIERLMRKGLIVREPAVRPMNESFKSFVLSVGVDDLAHCEEKARKSSNWEVLKVPLSIGVASVIVFLLLTQREIYNSALPIITAITAGVPTFFKLVSVFHGDAAGKAGG